MASRGRSVLRCVFHDVFASAAKGLIVVVLWFAETCLLPLALAQQAAVAPPDAPGVIDNNGCVEPVPTLSVSDVNGRFKKVEARFVNRFQFDLMCEKRTPPDVSHQAVP